MQGAATAAGRPATPRSALPAAGAFLAYLALAMFDGSQAPFEMAAMAIAVAAGLTLVALLVPGSFALSRTALVAAGSLALLTALIIASATWTADDGRVYIEAVRAFAYLGVLLIVVIAVRADEVRPILGGIAAAIVAVAAVAVGSRLAPGLLTGDATFLREFPDAVRGRLSYPLGYWNGLAACMAAGIILLAWLGAQASGARARAAAIGAMPLLVLAIYLSGSRGGLLAAIAGVVVLLALTPVRTRVLAGVAIGAGGGLVLAVAANSDQAFVEGATGRSAELALAALIAVVMLACLLLRLRADVALRLPRVPRLLQGRFLAGAAVIALFGLFVLGDGIERVGELGEPKVDDFGRGEFSGRFLALGSNGRVQLWESALDAFESEPLHGIGAGAYGFWWNENGTLAEPARDAHSLFLEALAELGPLGLAAVLALFGAGLAGVRRLTFGDSDGTVAALAGLLTAGLVGAAVDWTWEIPAVFVLNILAIGLLAGPLTRASHAPAPAPRRSGGGALAFRAVLAAAGAAAFVAAGALFLSERALDESRDLASAQDYSGAAATARDAARLQPASEEPWLQLGQVQTLAGDYEGTAASLERAVELSPSSPQANLALAVAYFALSDPRAEQQEERAIELLPAER